MHSCYTSWIARTSSPASTSYATPFRNEAASLQVYSCPPFRKEVASLQVYSCPSQFRKSPSRTSICFCKATADSDSLKVRKGVENLVIIGSGPAGYTAAIYAARANLRPVIFEGLQVGGPRGGQLMTTSEVENFPGFPEGITGPDLMDRMRAQAERWGAVLITEDVEVLDLSKKPFTVRSSEFEVRTNSLILATGATAKRLGLPSEEKFWSQGISACAICDGSSPAFKEQELAVVGGGDTAAEEALYLTKYGKKVHLLVRGQKMRASRAMQDRVNSHPKVEVHYEICVEDVVGDAKGKLSGLKIRNGKTGSSTTLGVKGLFYGIGHQPNNQIFAESIQLDEAGYVKVDGVKTSKEGVFAAGDLFDKEWRQAITAAGSGCMAALSAERYLNENNLLQEFHQEQAPKQKEEAAEDSRTSGDSIDLDSDRHRGQIALRKLYHESPRPLVVLYTAQTCGPCRTLKPILQSVADEYSGQIHLIEIDIDTDSEVAAAGGVNGTPTVQMFKNKALLQHLPGVKMKRDYRRLILESIEQQ